MVRWEVAIFSSVDRVDLTEQRPRAGEKETCSASGASRDYPECQHPGGSTMPCMFKQMSEGLHGWSGSESGESCRR